MSEPLLPSSTENKLNELNKKIVEIKKKIQLSGNTAQIAQNILHLIYTVLDKLDSESTSFSFSAT
jgi:predicted ribosome quality control (RQC) complex YloA/Tae2 family protein